MCAGRSLKFRARSRARVALEIARGFLHARARARAHLRNRRGAARSKENEEIKVIGALRYRNGRIFSGETTEAG